MYYVLEYQYECDDFINSASFLAQEMIEVLL